LVLSAEKEPTFEIDAFSVKGNTLLPEDDVDEVLQDFLGEGKTAADVEKARTALEKLYHDKGYPAVLVNIPEQTVTEGTIELQVIESKIGDVRVTGNRYFTAGKILRQLPSVAPGKVLYIPDVQKDFEKLNQTQDIKASPVLSPGRELGVTDVEVKVEDKIPLHASLEVNNRSTPGTSELRLIGGVHYDNLWQKEHSAALQYIMSPQNTEEVEVWVFSYMLPAPWKIDHQLALYGVISNSQATAIGQGFQVIGKGQIYGSRYSIPLPSVGNYGHNITLGVDYKHFDQAVGFGGEIKTPISYLPFSLAYGSFVPDSYGLTRFNVALNMAFRGLVTDEQQFETARFKANGNYLYLTAGIEKTMKFPAGTGLFLKLDGQISDQPLVSYEQYLAGGIQSVRGYKDAEAAGDDAVHGTAEFSAPDLGGGLGLGNYLQLTPYIFYDFAWLKILDPLPSQNEIIRLQGTGGGVRGTLLKNVEYEVNLGIPLVETVNTPSYSKRIHFKVKFQF
jgi:hemolysin activation/secretion protein